MHWPSAVPGAGVPVGARRRARRSGPVATVFRLDARRRAAAHEDQAEASSARPVHPGDRALDRADGAVPAAVGGARLPVHVRRGDQASEAEPHRADGRRSVRLVARRPAAEHLPACACPPGEAMDAVPPSRVGQSVHAEMTRRPRYVDSLRIQLVPRRSVPAECAARRSERNRPDQRTLPTEATPGGAKSAGNLLRSELLESSGSAW